MEAPQPQEQAALALAESLRRVRWSVLASLAVCALLILLQTADAAGTTAHPSKNWFTSLAFGLGIASILARAPATSPKTEPRRRVNALLLALILAGGLGLLGVAAAFVTGERETPLLYTLAGVLFSLRPFPPLAPSGT